MLKKSEKFRRFVSACLNHRDTRYRFRKEILIGDQRRTYYFLCVQAPESNDLEIVAERQHKEVYAYALPVADLPADPKARRWYLHKIWLGIERQVIKRHQD